MLATNHCIMLWTKHKRRLGAKAVIDRFRDGDVMTDADGVDRKVIDFEIGQVLCLRHDATDSVAWITVEERDHEI